MRYTPTQHTATTPAGIDAVEQVGGGIPAVVGVPGGTSSTSPPVS
jgi:hypothetical protein